MTMPNVSLNLGCSAMDYADFRKRDDLLKRNHSHVSALAGLRRTESFLDLSSARERGKYA
jgi:hypothetical protein